MNNEIRDILMREHRIDSVEGIKTSREALAVLNTLHKIRHQDCVSAKRLLDKAMKKSPTVATLKGAIEKALIELHNTKDVDILIDLILINHQETTDTISRLPSAEILEDISESNLGKYDDGGGSLDSLVFEITNPHHKLSKVYLEWDDLIEPRPEDSLIEWIKLDKLKSELEANQFIHFDGEKHGLWCKKAQGARFTALKTDSDLKARVMSYLKSGNKWVEIEVRRKKVAAVDLTMTDP